MPPSLPSDSGGEEPPIDDFIGSDDEFRPPLPPEDRIWRHPSEVAAATRSRNDTERPRPSARVSVGTIAVSALLGATLSLGIVAALGGFDQRVVERHVAVEMTARDPSRANALAKDTAPSVVGLSVKTGDRWMLVNAVVLRSDGLLLTTAGPLAAADQIEAHLPDGVVASASVVGVDPTTDVAVLRVGNGEPAAAVFGSSADLDVGDDAMVIGVGGSGDRDPIVMTSLIRAVGQRVSNQDATLHDVVLIDTDVPTELSGAPVVDATGAVIGILASPGLASAPGASVVIPVDAALHFADEIVEFGRARHVWLGIGAHDLTRSESDTIGLNGGAMVSSVHPDSPAEISGIGPGDVIVSIDGVDVKSMADLVVQLREHEPGDSVEIVVSNGGETRTISTDLADRADR